MEARLQWMAAKPSQWVHWEPLRGGVEAQALLERRYPGAACFVMESHEPAVQAASAAMTQRWWTPQRWLGPTRHWGPPQEPVQMLWANMALHMAPDPQATIAQWQSL
ncbi:MAG: biotin synthase, partial [Burkholderiales bacterium PBB4]